MRVRLALALVSLLIPLIVAEAFLRIRGSESHALIAESARMALFMQLHERGKYLRLPPDETLRGWGHEIRLNRLGMRDPEPATPKPEGARRILILGDSFAFGHGVAQDEALPSLLRASLARQNVNVVSAAMPGWNTLEQERFLDENMAELDPDMVLILYVINDREPDNPFRRARLGGNELGSRLHRWLVMHSRLFEWVAFTHRKLWVGSEDPLAWELVQWEAHKRRQLKGQPFSDRDLGWRKSRDALMRIRETMRARGGDFLIVLHRDEPAGPTEAAWEALVELAGQGEVEVVDALPFYQGHTREEVVLNLLVDPHPNALGHRLLAAGIEASLREKGWLQPALVHD